MDLDTSLGERIRQARERKGMTPAELARSLRKRGHNSITPGRMWEIEHGGRRVKAAEVPDFCRELGVPPWWLLGMTRDESAVLDALFIEQ